MFSGPIFRRELQTTARSPRTYLLRTLAAAAIAVYVAVQFEIPRDWTGPAGQTTGKIAELAYRAFHWFVMAQVVVVVGLVPLLAANVIAEEKARGTLGMLLASRLGSAEILADKLASRSLHILSLLALGLSILALIGQNGGIDPVRVLIAYVGTLTTAWVAAALSGLVSVHARTAVGAVIGAYVAVITWLALPLLLALMLEDPQTPASVAWLRPYFRVLARSSPFALNFPSLWGPLARGPSAAPAMARTMAVLQVVLGVAAFAVAARRLRPVYREQLGARPPRSRAWIGRILGLTPKPAPPCGDDAMWWKESRFPESGRLGRVFLLIGLLLVTHETIQHLRWNRLGHYLALDEFFQFGFDLGPWGRHGYHRNSLNYIMCNIITLLYTMVLAASAVLAASSVAGERRRDTWSSLLSTPLDRAGILRAKMIGTLWSVRVPLGMIGFLYLASLASTAMHPIGFLLGVVGISAFLWLAIALGTYVSLRSKDTTQAIFRTLSILLAINLGPALGLMPFVGGFYPASILGGCTPRVLLELPMSRMRVLIMAEAVWRDSRALLAVALVLGVVLAHALAAWFLTRAALRRIGGPVSAA